MWKFIVALVIFLIIIGLGAYKIYCSLKRAPEELSELKKMKLETEKNIGVLLCDPKASKPEIAEEEKGGVKNNGQAK